jgi:membrane protease YdiL (CAAX protease family)
VVWLANGLAAVLFAAIHLPQAAALFGLSAPVLVFVLTGNGLPGLAFGWLYWRRGLLAAMAAHCAADIVMKVVLPLVPFR